MAISETIRQIGTHRELVGQSKIPPSGDIFCAPTKGVRKTKRMIEVEQRVGEPIGPLLDRLHHAENMNTTQMKDHLGIGSRHTVRLWMKKYNVPQRSARKAMLLARKDPEKLANINKGYCASADKRKKAQQVGGRRRWAQQPAEKRKQHMKIARDAFTANMIKRMEKVFGEEPHKRYESLREEGLSPRKIAEKFKVPLGTLEYWKTYWENNYDDFFADKIYKQLWSAAKGHGLLRKIVGLGLMEKSEVVMLRHFFQGKTKERPSDEMLDKLSIAVANVAE